jgi:ribosome-associated translation inhibitor RaiA
MGTTTRRGARLEVPLDVVIRGDAPSEAVIDYARDKVLMALRPAPRRVRSGRLTLSSEPHRSIRRPASAEVLLDLDGRVVVARAAARSAREAVDLLEDRLRQRLVRVRAERESARRRQRWNASEGSR